jgi:hypothetical protein
MKQHTYKKETQKRKRNQRKIEGMAVETMNYKKARRFQCQ